MKKDNETGSVNAPVEPSLASSAGVEKNPRRPFSLALREQLWDSHPIFRWQHQVRIRTPPLDRVSNIVSDCIYRQKLGRFFVGDPRFGKTQTILFLVDWIAENYRDVPVVVLEAVLRMRSSELAVYGEILSAIGFQLPRKKRADECCDQVVNMLWSIAAARREHRLVMFVDEAQNWTLNEWAWLKGVLNRLNFRGITLIVLPFGQRELQHVGTSLRAAGREDLRQRFLGVAVELQGIASVKELAEVLQNFDEETVYPANSGWSFVEFFLPQAFASGWRMADEAVALWGAYTKAASNGIAGISVGMEWIRGAIQFALIDFSARDAPSWRPTPADWARAVASSDFADTFNNPSLST